ncbi:MAG: hypothetical protein QOJ68_767, partial [Blastococcus sp.]|nr:hypothetical protein [Blastococcus sp.]
MSWRASLAAAAAVAAAVTAVVLVGSEHPHPAAATASPQTLPIASASLSCPGSPGASTPTTSLFGVGPGVAAQVPGPARLEFFGLGEGSPS